MAAAFDLFEQIVRRTPAPATSPSEATEQPAVALHPFELRNVHPDLPPKVRKLFDDGHGAEATFHAFKFVEKVVQKHSGSRETGRKLMMNVFSKSNPVIKLNRLANPSEEDEQEGYQFMFAGSVAAIVWDFRALELLRSRSRYGSRHWIRFTNCRRRGSR